MKMNKRFSEVKTATLPSENHLCQMLLNILEIVLVGSAQGILLMSIILVSETTNISWQFLTQTEFHDLSHGNKYL